MAASVTQNPPVKSESKTSKKKKAKVESVEGAPVAPPMEASQSNGVAESGDGSYESPYIKELYK